MKGYFKLSLAAALFSIPMLTLLGVLIPDCKTIGCGAEKILIPLFFYFPIYVNAWVATIVAHVRREKVHFKLAYWFLSMLPFASFLLLFIVVEYS
jgi:hypothetical protein